MSPPLNRTRPPRLRSLRLERLEDRRVLAGGNDSSPDYEIAPLVDMAISGNTGEKPQSKVWEHADRWWTVLADSTGTWVWRLDGTAWTPVLKLSSTKFQADVKPVGNLVHVLLERTSSSRLASLEYVTGAPGTYRLWSARPTLASIPLSTDTETATVDIDSTGRLWVASDTASEIQVQYSDAPYATWSAPVVLATNVSTDDISAVIGLPNNSIGVFWSNQVSRRFGFRVHQDGASPMVWSSDELPGAAGALNVGHGLADDHINLAVASDGTLFSSVKTSYNNSNFTKIGLLVRSPAGQWSPLHQVDTAGTRPIVQLDELRRRLLVIYRSTDTAGPIVFRESAWDAIAFSERQTLIPGASMSNPSGSKQTFRGDLVVIASASGLASGALITAATPVNQAPVVDAGLDATAVLGHGSTLNGTVTDDGLPSVPGAVTTAWSKLSGPGSVSFADFTSVDTVATFSEEGTYVLRLSASDGELSSSDEVTITVIPQAANQAPAVSAGADQSILLSASATLDATVTDEGLPNPPGSVVTTWSKVSGPGSVSFSDPSMVDTSATFAVEGTYVLRLTAFDGELAGSDDIVINVTNPPPVVQAFQDRVWPDASYQGAQDSRIRSNYPNDNFGTSSSLLMDGAPDSAVLMKWDIGAIPAGSVVQSASINLYVTEASIDTYELYALSRNWTESGVTWNAASAGIPWTMAGAQGSTDRGTTVLGVISAAAVGTITINLNPAGIAVVQGWVNSPPSNFGLIAMDYGAADPLTLRSRETGTASTRPKLSVAYVRSGSLSGTGTTALAAAGTTKSRNPPPLSTSTSLGTTASTPNRPTSVQTGQKKGTVAAKLRLPPADAQPRAPAITASIAAVSVNSPPLYSRALAPRTGTAIKHVDSVLAQETWWRI